MKRLCGLALLLALALASPAAASSRPGFCAVAAQTGSAYDAVRAVNAIDNAALAQANAHGTDALDAYRQSLPGIRDTYRRASTRIGRVRSCHPLADRYKQLAMEELAWRRAHAGCLAIYKALGTPGGPSVGQWLTCIHPVNLALTALARAKRDTGIALVGVRCEAAHRPSAVSAARAEQAIAVVEGIQQVYDLTQVPEQLGDIERLLVEGGWTNTVNAVYAGKQTIEAFAAVAPTAGAQAARAAPQLVARGSRRLKRRGPSVVRVRLTAAGRRLLAGAPQATLTIRARFARRGGWAVAATSPAFTLAR